MRFALSEDQRELQFTVRSFLERTSPLATLLKRLETEPGHDERVWRRIATELELIGLLVPEEYGGSGFSLVEVCAVLEEMGRVLYRGPYLSSAVLATTALLACDDEAAKHEFLPPIVGGDLLVTFASGDSRRMPGAGGEPARASKGAHGWTVDGRAEYVIDGGTADVLIVAATADDGVECFAVESSDRGVIRSPLAAIDLTRPLVDIVFHGASARRLTSGGSGDALTAKVLDVAAIAQAAEQVGSARTSLDMAIEYAGQRRQFGRPIGSFQAIKHRCADAYVALEAAHAAAFHAAWTAHDLEADLTMVSSVAKACCSDALYRVATSASQIYGGVGFTWEHTAHLFLRRAVSSRELLGPPSFHRARVGNRLAGDRTDIPTNAHA
jgi:alkylation response protein AidB-like acyl-CoA dehydrogenase